MDRTTPQTIARARRLRRQMQGPEASLWSALRARPQGLRFRRQHPIGPFVLDFFCASARLAIELDGVWHDDPKQRDHDFGRDAWLEQQGVATLRPPAVYGLRARDAAVDLICKTARERAALLQAERLRLEQAYGHRRG